MSSSEAFKSEVRSGAQAAARRARRVLRASLASGLAAALAVATAGFRPLYGALGGAGAEQKLSQIEFATIPAATASASATS